MIIPIEDYDFIATQKPSVRDFWMQCWRSDPYGSRWQVLNHKLSYSAFKKAKKLLSDRGLFLFKRESSIRDNRETVCWLVLNLHGSRQNDYWLGNQSKKADSEEACQDSHKASQASPEALEAPHKASISIETQAQQGLQNPSGGISGSSSVTLQRVTEEPEIESEVGDRRASPASDERVSPAPPPKEKKKPKISSLATKSQNDISRENSNPVEDIPAPPEKNILLNPLEENYVYDWRSTAAIGRAKAQNFAIEAEQKTEEYQYTSKEALARIRANLAKKKERMDAERRAKDWEASPMRLIDSQNVEELKREQEAERSQEEFLRHGRVINRPALEDYLIDW